MNRLLLSLSAAATLISLSGCGKHSAPPATSAATPSPTSSTAANSPDPSLEHTTVLGLRPGMDLSEIQNGPLASWTIKSGRGHNFRSEDLSAGAFNFEGSSYADCIAAMNRKEEPGILQIIDIYLAPSQPTSLLGLPIIDATVEAVSVAPGKFTITTITVRTSLSGGSAEQETLLEQVKNLIEKQAGPSIPHGRDDCYWGLMDIQYLELTPNGTFIYADGQLVPALLQAQDTRLQKEREKAAAQQVGGTLQ